MCWCCSALSTTGGVTRTRFLWTFTPAIDTTTEMHTPGQPACDGEMDRHKDTPLATGRAQTLPSKCPQVDSTCSAVQWRALYLQARDPHNIGNFCRQCWWHTLAACHTALSLAKLEYYGSACTHCIQQTTEVRAAQLLCVASLLAATGPWVANHVSM